MPDRAASKRKGTLPPYVWTFTTYFAEGFPYTIIRMVSTVFFRDLGMGLETIGLTSLYGLPWIIKFLWAPHVDRYATKRSWLLAGQSLLTLLFWACLPASYYGRQGILVIALLFLLGSFLAASHDIAIDGYYMESLTADDQARFVGYRVMAYRIAMMTGTGIIVTTGAAAGWPAAFLLIALCMSGLLLIHSFCLPQHQEPGRAWREMLERLLTPRRLGLILAAGCGLYGLHLLLHSTIYTKIQATIPLLKKCTFAGWVGIGLLLSLIVIALYRKPIGRWLIAHPDPFYGQAFYTFMDRPGIGVILAFIIFIRTGEFTLSAMAAPFMIDLGLKIHYGWLSGAVGLPCSIIGAMIGGWLISRFTLRRMIWPFLLAQNLTNLVYMALAFSLNDLLVCNTGATDPVPMGAGNLALVASVHGFDQFAGGLGTAVLMTFLMHLCRDNYKAAHYAIGTGLMSVSGLYAGVLSGFLAAWLGYATFFGISFLLSIPGMVLVLFLPDLTLGAEAKPTATGCGKTT